MGQELLIFHMGIEKDLYEEKNIRDLMLNGKILKAFPLSQRDRHEVKKNWEVGGKIITICR